MRWRLGLLLALAVTLVFANCLGNAFLWDDEQFVVKNQFLTSWRLLPNLFTENVVAGSGLVSNLYRPLQSLTHFLDVRIWGLQPWGHHLSNLLLHVAASLAVFRWLASLLPVRPAAMAAGLFALHPLQSEAVAYVSGRGDLLAILFLCLGLLSFRAHVGLCAMWAFLAMLSKESLVLFPLFLALHEWAAGRAGLSKRQLPLWLLSGGYGLARLTVLNFQNTLNFYEHPNILTEHVLPRLYTYLTTLPKGLLLWFWPADLHHERSWLVYTALGHPRVWLACGLVAVLALAACSCRRRSRLVTAGILWFFIATIPTSNLLVLINALFYDHWFILPGLGLSLVVAAALGRLELGPTPWRLGAIGAYAVALAACALLSVRYNRIWHDPIRLYTHILAREPRSAKIHNNLAMAYADAGRHDEAVRLYQQAIALSDEFPETHHNLGNTYLELGDEARALEEFSRAVALNPNFHHTWTRIGMIRLRQHRFEEAAEAFGRAQRAYPYSPEPYLGLAAIHQARGDASAARVILDAGLRHLPGHPGLRAALETLPSSGIMRDAYE